MAFHIYLSHFYKLSGLLSNLFLAEIYFSEAEAYLNKVTSSDFEKIVAKDFFPEILTDTSCWLVEGIHRNGGILPWIFQIFLGEFSPGFHRFLWRTFVEAVALSSFTFILSSPPSLFSSSPSP